MKYRLTGILPVKMKNAVVFARKRRKKTSDKKGSFGSIFIFLFYFLMLKNELVYFLEGTYCITRVSVNGSLRLMIFFTSISKMGKSYYKQFCAEVFLTVESKSVLKMYFLINNPQLLYTFESLLTLVPQISVT